MRGRERFPWSIPGLWLPVGAFLGRFGRGGAPQTIERPPEASMAVASVRYMPGREWLVLEDQTR